MTIQDLDHDSRLKPPFIQETVGVSPNHTPSNQAPAQMLHRLGTATATTQPAGAVPEPPPTQSRSLSHNFTSTPPSRRAHTSLGYALRAARYVPRSYASSALAGCLGVLPKP
jgi:hypothetical protein